MNVFERHTLLNKLAARQKLNIVLMASVEKVLPVINRVKHLGGTSK